MNTTLVLLTLATFFSTLIGGSIIVKFKKYLPYFFAFAAGSLVAVSFLELLPESLKISNSIGFPTKYIMLIVVISYFVYSLLERFFLTHHEDEEDSHRHIMGSIGAGSLVIHSFLDGIAIGAAFAVNPSVGFVVALAVISHDFTDGINTVIIMLKNKHNVKRAIMFLILDAIAPVLGIVVATAITIPEKALAILLAVFVGEFLYIGAATLLPETRKHKSKKIIIAMALGIIVIAVLSYLISL